jgi:hypothetical protein
VRERVLDAALVGGGMIGLAALVHTVAPLPPAVVALGRPALVGLVAIVAVEEALRIGGWGRERVRRMRWSRAALSVVIGAFLIGRLASERWLGDHGVVILSLGLALGGVAALVDAWQAWRWRAMPPLGIVGATAAGGAGLLLGTLVGGSPWISNHAWERLFFLALSLIGVAGAAYFRLRRATPRDGATTTST